MGDVVYDTLDLKRRHGQGWSGWVVPTGTQERLSSVQLSENDLILITGATGWWKSSGRTGSRQRTAGSGDCSAGFADGPAEEVGVELVSGDLDQPESLRKAVDGATLIIHCAAKVGDWGPTEEYRRVNVDGTRALLDAALASGSLKRWIQISSLGVYEGRDHFGTDETTPPSTTGIDG